MNICTSNSPPSPSPKTLDDYLKTSICMDIKDSNISLLQKYGHIDAFSERKIIDPLGKLNTSSRTMGKNDLWIAALASEIKECILLTHNFKDFSHLQGNFLKVINFNEFVKGKKIPFSFKP